jgi:hypothetical protein
VVGGIAHFLSLLQTSALRERRIAFIAEAILSSRS